MLLLSLSRYLGAFMANYHKLCGIELNAIDLRKGSDIGAEVV